MPWRLFAIEPWNQMLQSAMLRMVYAPLSDVKPELLFAQREMQPARLARLERPADPRQLWTEHWIDSIPDLAQPNSLETADFDGDGRPDILIAEKAGAARLIVLYNQGGGRFKPDVIAQGRPIQFARAVDLNGDGHPDILVIRRDAIAWWENH